MVVLKTARHLETVAHPLRLEILERLQLDGPDSIAGLAKKLDRRPNALSYHVLLLERAGVLTRAGSRRSGRRDEAIYDLAAASIALGIDPRSSPMRRAATRSAGVVLRMAHREIRRALEDGMCSAAAMAGRPLGRRVKAWLTDEDLSRVQQRLDQIERDLERGLRRKRGRPYALTVVLVPLGPERKE
jgi:DNA-binding Lrp family transcriptional regulator